MSLTIFASHHTAAFLRYCVPFFYLVSSKKCPW
jgi:hypothetical protein